MKRFAKTGTVVATTLLFTLLIAGCYWTPEEDEGGITLEISTNGISASQTFDGFFLGYVIADDLMRGDEAAAEEALAEVDTALNEAFEAFATTGNLEDFAVNVAFPSIQLQLNAFTGSSGSNTFAGLRAGREYLVVVIAATETTEGIGYTVATVEAGENKSVSLDLGDNWSAFYQFLSDEYGVEQLATIQIVDNSGAFEFTDYHYDLIDGSSPLPSGFFAFDGWYAGVTVLNENGDEIPKSGDRNTIPTGTVTFYIEAVAPNRSWRVLLTPWSNRSVSGSGDYYVSTPFTTPAGSVEVLSLPDNFTSFYN